MPPLVWAIEPAYAPLYWFPRDCARVTVWAHDDAQRSVLRGTWGARVGAAALRGRVGRGVGAPARGCTSTRSRRIRSSPGPTPRGNGWPADRSGRIRSCRWATWWPRTRPPGWSCASTSTSRPGARGARLGPAVLDRPLVGARDDARRRRSRPVRLERPRRGAARRPARRSGPGARRAGDPHDVPGRDPRGRGRSRSRPRCPRSATGSGSTTPTRRSSPSSPSSGRPSPAWTRTATGCRSSPRTSTSCS